MVQKFKEYLGRCFSMKDLGKLKYFLGIEVSRGPDGIFLSQRKYALDIISDSGTLGARPAYTPFMYCPNLCKLLGKLIWRLRCA
ncbi:putative reverse transcriptase, RNA-dependent DNA polymerase [Arabidopsis thaliana]